MKQKQLTADKIVLTGKCDNVVLYTRRGRAYAKKLGECGQERPRSDLAWSVSQARLRYLVSLYQALGGTRARVSWRMAPKRSGQTGYNAFVSRNYAAFDAGEAVADHARLTLADGTLRHPLGLRAEAGEGGTLTLAWETAADRLLGARDDRPRLLLMPDDDSYGIVAREGLDARREDGRAAVTLAPEEGRPPFAYLYWESEDGRRFSPTQFLPIPWPEQSSSVSNFKL